MGTRLMKDFHRLMKRIERISNGQAKLGKINWDEDTSEFIITIRPSSGYYKGGFFDFQVSVPDGYPNESPVVYCLTNIYHPNIDTSDCDDPTCTNVCLNFFDLAEVSCGFEGIVHGLIFLLKNPNIEDPLSPYFRSSIDDAETFEENVKAYMKGDDVDGISFEKNFFVAQGITILTTSPEDEDFHETDSDEKEENNREITNTVDNHNKSESNDNGNQTQQSNNSASVDRETSGEFKNCDTNENEKDEEEEEVEFTVMCIDGETEDFDNIINTNVVKGTVKFEANQDQQGNTQSECSENNDTESFENSENGEVGNTESIFVDGEDSSEITLTKRESNIANDDIAAVAMAEH
ncbi:UBC12-like protein, partial [Mya arenaria]